MSFKLLQYSLAVTAVLVAPQLALPGHAEGQRSYGLFENGLVGYTYTNGFDKPEAEAFRARQVVVNPMAGPRRLEYSPCDQLRGDYPLPSVAVQCSEVPEVLAPGDSAWAELIELKEPGVSAAFWRPHQRVPFVVEDWPEGLDRAEISTVVGQAILAQEEFFPIPATEVGARALGHLDPVLLVRVLADSKDRLQLCWRDGAAELDCHSRTTSTPSPSPLSLGALIHRAVFELLGERRARAGAVHPGSV